MNQCEICNMPLGRFEVADHYKKHHPELKFEYKGSAYVCSFCGAKNGSLQGVAGMVSHYRFQHTDTADNAEQLKSSLPLIKLNGDIDTEKLLKDIKYIIQDREKLRSTPPKKEVPGNSDYVRLLIQERDNIKKSASEFEQLLSIAEGDKKGADTKCIEMDKLHQSDLAEIERLKREISILQIGVNKQNEIVISKNKLEQALHEKDELITNLRKEVNSLKVQLGF